MIHSMIIVSIKNFQIIIFMKSYIIAAVLNKAKKLRPNNITAESRNESSSFSIS